MARMKGDGSYKVGHGKPPVEFQFKKGKSGNRSGRPKGSKNKQRHPEDTLANMILDEGHGQIDLTEGTSHKRMAAAKAMLRQLA